MQRLRTSTNRLFLSFRIGSANATQWKTLAPRWQSLLVRHSSSQRDERRWHWTNFSRSAKLYVIFPLPALAGCLYYIGGPNIPPIFQQAEFTLFIVIAKEQVSTNNFILAVRPVLLLEHKRDPYGKQWSTGIWSVEFKQPQLQIARSYTPLPPTTQSCAEDSVDVLRFLIKGEEDGEISNYLARLRVGDQVQLRGPHTRLELSKDITDVVFLAGGTGIAPAMQAAYTLLEAHPNDTNSKPRMHIVWANQRREDCLGGVSQDSEENTDMASTRLVRELREMQEKHPDNLKIDYLVDEERTLLDQKRLSSITKNTSLVKFEPLRTRIDSRLIIVSGPEGFVDFIAGPKKWCGGKETQGELGGLLGRRNVRDWKIWKL